MNFQIDNSKECQYFVFFLNSSFILGSNIYFKFVAQKWPIQTIE